MTRPTTLTQREKLRKIIFEADTPAGKAFDVALLLAILPTYASLFVPGSQALIVIRALRLVRIFRVLKLARYVGESAVLMAALRASRRRSSCFC